MTETLTKKVKKKKGFTLIELIIVVAIIAILAALAIPKLMGTQDNAKKKADIANGKLIHDAVATLITEDKITLSGTTGSTTIEISSSVASGTDNDDLVKNKLQTIPVPKYNHTSSVNTQFCAVIDNADKSITVYVDAGSTHASSDKQVYPTPHNDYAN
ncbi:prepilin-type N-terminal cleavage/methylation domain-containing protein [Clostridium magnum]|uniref:Type II secretion system protein G n=1 Tax=Clostridium magnum DSM 2767 TaxID=1121326 RepID=A0A161X1Q7_9CLOT|nr:prepilin-type N-terminal cleavage/methylation domain-containing protein [Clostridium magnum]KZL93398.1 type II secretion system protein G precursor [Clostridium magnum DSM 2767]SHI15871.1 type IV pilus assembly protein PilA [Clostridium magnum DSM 2767]